MDWNHKQGRILTANGLADEFYTAERGFPFIIEELPHYFLEQGETRLLFHQWSLSRSEPIPICGAWNRLLFTGGFEHSTSETERVYNIQTNSFFIDLRIPTSRSQVIPADRTSLASLTDEELRLFARQHVFGGYSLINQEQGRIVCTRHHCMDWNYVGVSRSRPNKWWVELNSSGNVWKEWAYAKDNFGQHYYMERWERLEEGNSLRLALRKREGIDGIVVVVGDHFNYLLDREISGEEPKYNKASLVDLVDAAIAKGDRETAEIFCGIDAGHGRLSEKWVIDCAIQPWKEGSALWHNIVVHGTSINDCWILWNDEIWDVFECSLKSLPALISIFPS